MNNDCDLAGGLREVHGRLAGRVAASDHNDMRAASQGGFARASAIVQPGAAKALLVRQVEPAVGHTGGADRSAGDDLGAVGQVAAHPVRCTLGAHALARQQDLGAEALHVLAGRSASSAPLIPPGKPSSFSIRELLPAWPPSA